jgi:membrane protein required for colicin V production
VNFLDILLLLIVGWNIVGGFQEGFARVGVSFAATVLGILFGFWFYSIPAGYIQDYIRSDTAANLFGFFFVFILFVIAGAIIGRMLSKMIKAVGLTFLDRLGGAGVGFVRGSLLALAMVTVITAFSPAPPPSFIADSRVMPYVSSAASVLSWIAPSRLKTGYRESLEKLRRMWTEQKRDVEKMKGKEV